MVYYRQAPDAAELRLPQLHCQSLRGFRTSQMKEIQTPSIFLSAAPHNQWQIVVRGASPVGVV